MKLQPVIENQQPAVKVKRLPKIHNRFFSDKALAEKMMPHFAQQQKEDVFLVVREYGPVISSFEDFPFTPELKCKEYSLRLRKEILDPEQALSMVRFNPAKKDTIYEEDESALN